MKEFEFAAPVGKALDETEVRMAAARALGVRPADVGEWRIVRRSVDSRGVILYRYRIEAFRRGEVPEPYRLAEYMDVSSAEPVIVIGAGPAGLFAALKLLTLGLKPVILERGRDIHRRKADIARLSTAGTVNPDSNYCFGEGGAGTFSDGKLVTRSSKRGDIREVLHSFVAFGADPDILVNAHPHIGSDRLGTIIENIRSCITEHGGEYRFDTRVTDIVRNPDGTITVVAKKTAPGNHYPTIENDTTTGITTGTDTFTARAVILATGHSARDIYELLDRKGWPLQAKGFALGVRVEHPQHLINRIQYHGKWQNFMPTAEYSFVVNIAGRGVFSFCMCPGGVIVPSMTSEGEVVLNGMSNSARGGRMANAGVVVSVEPGDIPGYDRFGELSLMRFQQDVERAMFRVTGSIKAPAQRMMDFCRGLESRDLPSTSYHPGAVPAPLHRLLPEHVYSRLKPAFPDIGRKMKGYYTNDALLLGVESRTSSPVRIPRDPDTLQYIAMPGLYPCGEGAGYAGGIVSSALDGINCAGRIRDFLNH